MMYWLSEYVLYVTIITLLILRNYILAVEYTFSIVLEYIFTLKDLKQHMTLSTLICSKYIFLC